ncbi:MAG: sulfocyanin-like copper-binding protein [Jatrophihabitans sp.]
MMGGDTQYHSAALTCSAPTSLPGQTVRVDLGDMGMTQMMSGIAPMGAQMRLQATPTTEPAGTISLIVSNVGWRTHELVILPLAPRAAAGQRVVGSDGEVSETGSVGEASSSCASGAGSGLTSGSVGWVTVTLAPGRYELVCNLPNHYADGMRQELTIT